MLCALRWAALDGGDWFVSASPNRVAPSGDYTPGCFLGVTDWSSQSRTISFDDSWVSELAFACLLGLANPVDSGPQCDFSTGERYICSTNDKGGFGTILRGM